MNVDLRLLTGQPCEMAALGFTETGEVQPYAHDTLVSESIVLAKPVHHEPVPNENLARRGRLGSRFLGWLVRG